MPEENPRRTTAEVSLSVELPDRLAHLEDHLRNFPERTAAAVVRGMDKANQFVLPDIIAKRLSGRGPFSPSLHRLGKVSGELVKQSATKPARIDGESGQVLSTIGSTVGYAALHEFGGRVTVRRHTRNLGSGKTVVVKSHTRAVPERAPFRTGINENAETYREEIFTEIEKQFAAI